MLELLKDKFTAYEILKGNFGIERESLRCDQNGKLALTSHPQAFGEKMRNPYITTDFSESQVELITPSFDTTRETYDFLSTLYNIAMEEIEGEYLWPQSMPCDIPDDEGIPIAAYCSCEEGRKAREYREGLLKKYGGKKQLISGIHYNFSFKEDFLKKLYNESHSKVEFGEFKDSIYLKIAKNYLKYRWLLIYLLSGTAVIHESFKEDCIKNIEEILNKDFTIDEAISYRNSQCGYGNKEDLFPNYDTIKGYVKSIEKFIENGTIDSHKELYSQIRLKGKDNNNLLKSLVEEGINYIEIRSIDINPFDKCGISKEDLDFVHLFIIFLLIEEEDSYDRWQEESLYNQRKIALHGKSEIYLRYKDKDVLKTQWALEILQKISYINNILSLNKENILEKMIHRVKNTNLTYASRIAMKVKEEGYINAHLNLAKEYKEDSYKNRFKFLGYEDLELSTQILMKEAVKKGIKIEVIDRNDNFILLDNGYKKEYIKQATKTSVDNYVTVLMMENKLVTKKVLKDSNIKVPKGMEFLKIEEALMEIENLINKPVVIKPKSTNFGLGISIFKEGGSRKDLQAAFKLAFSHDNTVLVEEFVQGKEYRFLVIGDKVEGILHRVPANVLGDGVSTIEKLVEDKNKDPLRGKGYKTPLEKITIDETVELYLRQFNLTKNSIPSKNEVVYLRENSNVSTGGDSVDYTDSIPDIYKNIAVKASKAVGATICGVDMMLDDYSDAKGNYAIIELNFNPAIHIHSYPYIGKERNIAISILKLLGLIIPNCK